MVETESLKGFYDRYPEDFASWRELIDVVEETAREFGFRELNAPSVERADLYKVKSGEELMDQMYNFEDKGGREISLIPEQTPTRARLIQKRKDLKTPVKWFDTSKRWRYENVQKGRDREFFQTDFDVFGIESVEADAEVIACAATIYQKLGVDDRVDFLINDRNILEQLLQNQGVSLTEEAMDIIDDMEKMSEEEFVQEMEEVLLEDLETEDVDAGTKAQLLFDFLGDLSEPIPKAVELLRENESIPEEEINRLEELGDQLDAYGVADMCRFDPSIVRGLAYYTGLVFEAFDSEGELRALFGGGRYDDLVGLFGKQEVPAVGFAFGYSTTIELLKKEDRWPLSEFETDVYVLSVSESVRDRALGYAKELRDEGLVVETDLASRGFGDQLGYADDMNARRVLIVGERDLENGEVTMKHMDTGEEEQLDEDEVLEYLGSEGIV